MNTPMPLLRAAAHYLFTMFLALVAWPAAAQVTQATDRTILLVANPGLVPPFAHSVLLVGPLGGGRHVGVLVNRPTELTLDKFFPNHSASQRARTAVSLGGPMLTNTLFAVVRSDTQPDTTGVRLSDDLFLIVEAATVDRLIERGDKDARYFIGVVTWAPGELAAEVSQGLWSLAAVESTEVITSSAPDDLWERLREPSPPSIGEPRPVRGAI